nr:YtxH domain-containing protein [Mammaliicoccus sp. Marseille-Q6498]
MQNKLVPAILIGGTIGAIVALADKNTRQSLSGQVQNIKEGNTSRGPSKINQLKDEVLYWKDVVEEIRRKNPELEQSLKDAKDTFVDKKNERKISGPTHS